FASMPDPDRLAQAFDRAQPVPPPVLTLAVERAETACSSFLEVARAATSASARSFRLSQEQTAMIRLPEPHVERHSLAGVEHVELGRLGPGLTRGEIFVVRGCLQAIGALDPLRTMILDTLQEVAGDDARTKAEAHGLTRLHEFVP